MEFFAHQGIASVAVAYRHFATDRFAHATPLFGSPTNSPSPLQLTVLFPHGLLGIVVEVPSPVFESCRRSPVQRSVAVVSVGRLFSVGSVDIGARWRVRPVFLLTSWLAAVF